MRKLGPLFSLLFLLCYLSTSFADTNPTAKKSPQPAASATGHRSESQGADIILLIDSSGSMRKTDPKDNRKTAAKLFISLLSKDDRAGVVSFGDTAKLLLPLTQNSENNRNKFMSAINKISSREFSTNIYDGVKKGFDELKASSGRKKVLVLMSDGKLTLGSKEKDAAALQALSNLLPELAKSGISLSTIAFSDLADARFLEDLAKAGGGFFKLARTDQDIHLIFASMFEKIKSPDTVPFDGDSFSIDKDIKEATVFITKKAGTTTVLMEPSGKKYTPVKFGHNIRWYEAKLFDLITIAGPAPGKWKVNLSTKEGNKVYVITNLSLKSSFNSNFVNKNDKVMADVWLERDGGIIKEKDILQQVSLSAGLSGPNGKPSKLALQSGGGPGGGKSGEGISTCEFVVTRTGDYELTFTAESKTFKRSKTIQFKVAEQAPAAQARQEKPSAPLSQAVQKSRTEQSPIKKQAAPVDIWGSTLIKFGILNGVLIAAAGIFLLVRMVKNKVSNRKKTKGKGKKDK